VKDDGRRNTGLTIAVVSFAAATIGCMTTTHRTEPSTLGVARRSADLEAVIDKEGPLEVETVVSTEWKIPRSGLVNLDDPKAKAAGLTASDEPIEIFFHVVKHPRFGTFLIDTGVERKLRDAPSRAALSGPITLFMKPENMTFDHPLGDWLAQHPEPIRGVFFTHLHTDHIAGAPDLPKRTPLFSGPGEASASSVLFFATQAPTDDALHGLPAISEWRFTPDPDGRFAGVVDVFGDGSFWALWTPGHTPGSTAYLARTKSGPILFTGDTSHTAWGWDNDVEPGSFTADHAANKESLSRLRRLAREHPKMIIRLGHQWATGQGPSGAGAGRRYSAP
jgi:glyoxylase-like metal-dependent hydrolase (beta-lactamase superfamily II)